MLLLENLINETKFQKINNILAQSTRLAKVQTDANASIMEWKGRSIISVSGLDPSDRFFFDHPKLKGQSCNL